MVREVVEKQLKSHSLNNQRGWDALFSATSTASSCRKIFLSKVNKLTRFWFYLYTILEKLNHAFPSKLIFKASWQALRAVTQQGKGCGFVASTQLQCLCLKARSSHSGATRKIRMRFVFLFPSLQMAFTELLNNSSWVLPWHFNLEAI